MQIQFQRGAASYTFNSDNNFETGHNYTVYLTGTLNFGLAPMHRITQRGPFQFGDSDIDFRLDPRVFSLPIVVPASTIDEHLDRRARLLQVFKPGNDRATIRLVWGEKERSIDVKVVGGLAMDTDSKDYTIRTVVQLRAADPTWYDTFGTITPISAQLFGTPTPYPKPYPVPYGSDTINKITTINYDGSWPSFPIIQITGPVLNLTMVDGRGNIIKLSTPTSAGQTWTLDLSYGAKTLVNQSGQNIFSAIDINSDLVNWGLYPDPTILNGTNTISVSAEGTNVDSQVIMYYSTRYVGV